MVREYELSNAAGKKHAMHLLKLLAICAVIVIFTAFLGLKRWPEAAYPFVYLMLVGVALYCVVALTFFGGKLDGAINKKEAKKKFLIKSGVIAAGAWVLLAILGFPMWLSGFAFIADIVLVAMLCLRLWEMLKNIWKMLDNTDAKGRDLTYPGAVVLHDVHTADALTSPFGKVLLSENAVLFVLPEMNGGYVEVQPNGTMLLKKKSFLGNQEKENKLDVSTVIAQAEDGIRRVIRLIEEDCKKQGVPVPELTYNYMLFMPNFERRNVAWDLASFSNLPTVHFWNEEKKYQEYLKNAAKADYFSGRACYTAGELQTVLQTMNQTCGIPRAEENIPEKIAGILARACELTEKK